MINISVVSSRYIFEYQFYRKLLVILGLLISIILLLIPLMFIFVIASSEGLMILWKNLNNSDMLHAIRLTLLIALISVPINLFFGIMISWLITRFNFFGRQLLLVLIDIPFVISPVIAGLLYLLFYNNNSFIGGYLDSYDVQIMFAWPGMILVTIFVTSPFVVHEVVPLMLSQGTQEDEAAILLGASSWQMFRFVTLPNIRWSLIYGAILTNARAIGEFGAVSIVSGFIRGETYTLPLQVELLYQDYNVVGAFVAASLLAFISIVILFLKKIVFWYLVHRS
ncbi:sulfate ABC transporter permease subunit CysW [Blochmannia endosymbiont of Camponotus (Colobopsis) obliquus]|uniref:sulfate ABC transporter permease subunit CysW n=1 Tax=Blochmannia endosymbiont of Camponotus (Colobopsis) obliquus TaxID=1505597 RepID=UPI00061A6466|nr:sulfate ABC transporter permease subunit CysW [Blochmannia endosymbiont of Camponotus (Colobopsis) obliquus]AKC60659.1 Sulfate transport system permease protein CysW [Blochmannia endosymbiont of Camponotus (Colobopsis) obliquus]